MVPFEINIKLSTINEKGLNLLIARKETVNSAIAERPCCSVQYTQRMLFILGSLESTRSGRPVSDN